MECKGYKSANNVQMNCIIKTFADSEYCLFHKQHKTEEETKLFWEVINYNRYPRTQEDMENIFDSALSPELTRITSTKIRFDHLSNMQGYIFPKIDEGIKFNAQYPDNHKYNFDDAIFECDVYFDDYTFNNVATFRNTIFKNEASFHNTIFNETVIFENPQFLSTSTHSIFRFKRAKFLGHTFEYKSSNFFGNFSGIEFGNTTIFKLNIDEDRGVGACTEAYRIAKMQAFNVHDNLKASDYYYKERCYRYFHLFYWNNFFDKKQSGFKKFQFFYCDNKKELAKDTFTVIGDNLNRWTIGYGEKPWRLLRPTFLLIFFFPIIYLFVGFNSFNTNNINGQASSSILHYGFYLNNISQNLKSQFISEFVKDYFDALFFSVCTFFAQNYGSAPINGLGQILVSVQMFFGVLFFSLFTATYLNKLLK